MKTPLQQCVWASKLDDDANVLGLIRSLPKEIVQEQVRLYEKRAETAVAEAAKEKPKLQLCPNPRYQLRMLVAQRFHLYCQRQGIVADKRMPYGAMKTFIEDNIVWKAKHKAVQSKQIRHWYNDWCSTTSNILAAVADEPCQVISKMSMLRSRAPQKQFLRRRAQGGGRPPKAPLIRQALYEWWSSIRYAIDWEQLAGERRSRGKIPGPFSSLISGAQSPPTPRRACLRILAEQPSCGIFQDRVVVVQTMGRGLRLIHANGEQKVPSAQEGA
jgi:hypothetical protein